jgi:hypothetical protein
MIYVYTTCWSESNVQKSQGWNKITSESRMLMKCLYYSYKEAGGHSLKDTGLICLILTRIEFVQQLTIRAAIGS